MIVGIIQARMNSSRCSGKILTEFKGKTYLEILLDRAGYSARIDKLIVATTRNPMDDIVEELCQKSNTHCFRGSENDVLGRFYEAVQRLDATVIVRLTADCPLVDYELIDKTISLLEEGYDYSAVNCPPENRRFPDGADVEAFTYEALEDAYNNVIDPRFREHVTFQFWQNDYYKAAQLQNDVNWSKYRITVDYPEDIEVVDFILGELERSNQFGKIREIVTILENHPEIVKKTSKYFFGQGWEVDE